MNELRFNILKLKENGKNNLEIANELKIAKSTVLYYSNENYRKKANSRAILNFRNRPFKVRQKTYQKQKEYQKNYHREKYKQDPIFREKQKERSREYSRSKHG